MLRALLRPAGRTCGLHASFSVGGRNCDRGRLPSVALSMLASSTFDNHLSLSDGRIRGLHSTFLQSASLKTGAKVEQRMPSTSPGVLRSLAHIRHAPVPALVLGLAGLAPFALAPVWMLGTGSYDAELVAVQTTYGAAILAFLGGVRWGAALPDSSPVQPSWFNLTTSVMPPLLAWAALLLPQPWPLPAVLASLLGVAYTDFQLVEYPAWFRGLRIVLTTVAVACLTLSAVCWLALPASRSRDGSAVAAAASDLGSGAGTEVAAVVAVPAAAGGPATRSAK